MRKIFFFFLALHSSIVGADNTAVFVKTQAELALLPPYCKGTQQVRTISNDPKSIEEYVAIYGEAFRHLHHYCWALNTENNAFKIRDNYLRNSTLTNSLADYKYFLERAPETFPLLPDVYISRARVLFTLQRDAEGVLDLNKAIQLKPDSPVAYGRLSDYYLNKGDKNNAIKILEQGIDNCEQATSLLKRLENLGKTYSGTPGSARKKEIPADPAASNLKEGIVKDTSEATPDNTNPTKSVEPPLDTRTEAEKKANPYCRFCP